MQRSIRSTPAATRRASAVRVALLALAFALGAATSAPAATQTVTDPVDPGYADHAYSTDIRGVTLDGDSTPGKVLLKMELEFAASHGIVGYVFLDTDADNTADYAIQIHPDPSRHPNLGGNDGNVAHLLRAVTTSTTACQSYDDGGTLPNPFTDFVQTPASLLLPATRTAFTIPIDLAAIGNPASFSWAILGDSSSGGPRFYDFVPDVANGLPEFDPHNPPGGERDEWFCSPAGDGLSAGYRVDMSNAIRFGAPVPVDLPPTVSIAASTEQVRPGQAFALSATASDPDGTIVSYAWDLDNDNEFDDADRKDITHAFPVAGTYRVGARVIDSGGNAAFAYRTIEVARRPLALTLTASKTSPAVREQITLTASVASDAPFHPGAIEWGIDSDNDGDEREPYVTSGPTWTLGFGAPQLWTIKARVTNAAGEVATARLQITVPNQPPVFREIRTRVKKVPDQPFNTESLVKGQPLYLEALLFDDNLTRPRVEWDLDGNGDYDEAAGERIERTYPTAGAKTAAVRIVDAGGLTAFGKTTFEVRESADAPCGGTAGSEGIRAVGCFKPDPVTPTTKFSKEPIKVNGLDLVPKDGGQINVGAGGLLFTSSQGSVQIKAGSVLLFDGRFAMDANCKPTQEECLLGRFNVPAFALLKGFPLKGDVDVYLTPQGTRVVVDVEVFKELGGFVGKADLVVTDKGGLVLNELEIQTPEFKIGKFEIGSFTLEYAGATRRWAGGGSLLIPTPIATTLAGDFAFSEITGFERFHAEVDGVSIPIDPFGAAFLQRIAATLEAKGFEPGGSPRIRIGGGVGISAGPRVAGVDIATVDGDFLFTLGDPFGVDVEGRISIGGFDIMGGTMGARTNGHAEMSGSIKMGFPLPASFKGKRQDATKTKVSKNTSNGADEGGPEDIISLSGKAAAWVEPRAFDLEAAIDLTVLKTRIARAQLLISSIGVAGCGEIVGLKAGFGYDWETKRTDLFALSCDLDRWRPEQEFEPLDSNGAGREPEDPDDEFSARPSRRPGSGPGRRGDGCRRHGDRRRRR